MSVSREDNEITIDKDNARMVFDVNVVIIDDTGAYEVQCIPQDNGDIEVRSGGLVQYISEDNVLVEIQLDAEETEVLQQFLDKFDNKVTEIDPTQ